MPSKVPAVQVRFADPRISRYLDILTSAGVAPSKSKLLEALSQNAILDAFHRWLVERRRQGATYSELFEETKIPVPEIMEIVEPELRPSEEEIRNHLKAIAAVTGIDLPSLWDKIPAFSPAPY